MEESELHEVLQHTMANVNGKAYRTMVNQLFSQNHSPVMDYTYDIDIYKVMGIIPNKRCVGQQYTVSLETLKKSLYFCVNKTQNIIRLSHKQSPKSRDILTSDVHATVHVCGSGSWQ